MAKTSTSIHDLVDPQRLGEYLNETLGGNTTVNVESHVAGFSNITCFVERGMDTYVLRRPPAGKLLPTAHDVARKYRYLKALHGTPARVPEPVVLCEDNDVIGAPFYLMEKKVGHVIRHAMPEALDSPDDRRRIGLEMVDALAEIHAVDWQAVGLTTRGGNYLDRQLKRWHSQTELTVGKVRDLPGLFELSEWLAANKPGASDVTIVHGDFKLDNVMFASETPARLIAIFDWEMAAIGDPLADLGWLMHTWGKPDGADPNADLPITALEGFATRDELAERYADRSGRSMHDFDWYHVLALWKLAVILEGLYVTYKTGNASNPASDAFEIQVPRLIERAQRLQG